MAATGLSPNSLEHATPMECALHAVGCGTRWPRTGVVKVCLTYLSVVCPVSNGSPWIYTNQFCWHPRKLLGLGPGWEHGIGSWCVRFSLLLQIIPVVCPHPSNHSLPWTCRWRWGRGGSEPPAYGQPPAVCLGSLNPLNSRAAWKGYTVLSFAFFDDSCNISWKVYRLTMIWTY